MKYLDLTGLGEVWANIKSYISSKIPTKTSQLHNDSNYATISQLPSKTSQLTNDSDFTTNAKLATKQDTISDLATIRSGASKGATAVQPSALNNYVDLSSEQTILGAKTFSNMLTCSSTVALLGTSTDKYLAIQSGDAWDNGSRISLYSKEHANYGGQFEIVAFNNENKASAFRFTVDGIIPIDIGGTLNLGTSTNKWNNVYANTYNGNLIGNVTGNADTATKATNNASGNELSNDIIKGLSVSGKVITYTKLDGTTGTITTQDTNTDTKVTNTLGNTTKAYITGTTSATTNTGTQIFDSGVYLTTTAGQLHADIDFPITEAQIAAIVV